MFVSFVVTTELQFYYIPTAPFLIDMGAAEAHVTAIMSKLGVSNRTQAVLAANRLNVNSPDATL